MDTYHGNNYDYDAENRLISVNGGGVSASFVYDGDGARVKSVVNGVTTYFVGNHYELTNGFVTKYYFAGSQRIAMRKGSTLTFLLSDHLGSTSLTTDGSGAKTSELRYKPWGEVRDSSGITPTNYTYTGQYSNTADFGLMYYNARWYDPSLGRFAQADSIVPAGVQGYDRYAYVNNNLLRYTDPSGHCALGGHWMEDSSSACQGGQRSRWGNSGRGGTSMSTPTPTWIPTQTRTPTPTWHPNSTPTSTPTTASCYVRNICPPTPTFTGGRAVVATIQENQRLRAAMGPNGTIFDYVLLGGENGYAGPGLGENYGNAYTPGMATGAKFDYVSLTISFIYSVAVAPAYEYLMSGTSDPNFSTNDMYSITATPSLTLTPHATRTPTPTPFYFTPTYTPQYQIPTSSYFPIW